MKKLFALIMSLFIMCFASACGNISLQTFIDYGDSNSNISSENTVPTSALEAYKQANIKREDESKGLAIGLDMTGKLSMNVSGQTQEVNISGTGAINESINQGAMNMAVNMPSLGMTMNTAWYCDGSNYYTWMMGKTYKTPLDDNAKASMSSTENNFNFDNIQAESEEITPAENGGYDYKIVAKIDTLDQGFVNSMLKSFEMDNVSANIKALSISGNIDSNGMLTTQNVVMSMETSIKGVTVPMDISMDYKYELKEDGYQITVPQLIDIQNAITSDSSILNGATAA